MEHRVKSITNLFENKEIRSLWDSEKEDYYFSVVDIVEALTDSPNPRNYWNMVKARLTEEESELYRSCVQLKLKARDGKMRMTDTLDTEGIFRLIESIPSPKAEPLKMWLAKLGKERVDEVFDPSLAVNRAVDYYRRRGYSDEWIKVRLNGIIDRKKLTDVWKDGGIEKDYEYAILTNEIYSSWSGMSAKQYKQFKGLRKEPLRDNMTDVEVVLTDLGEISTREIAKEQKPKGLKENIIIAKKGGNIAKIARFGLEEEIGKTIISKDNALSYQYIDDKKQELK